MRFEKMVLFGGGGRNLCQYPVTLIVHIPNTQYLCHTKSYFEVVSLVVYVHGYVVFIFVRFRLPDKRRPLFGFQGNLNSNHI